MTRISTFGGHFPFPFPVLVIGVA